MLKALLMSIFLLKGTLSQSSKVIWTIEIDLLPR